jgi:NAD(P)-dependent dehydrogenase (short-subunit alcohol dehydrogenase family)
MNNNLNFDSLKDKVIVITGGTGIIGVSLCRALAAAGVKLGITSLYEHETKRLEADLIKEFGISAIGTSCDVTNKESIIKAKEVINENLGSIDGLINCAGGNLPGATTQLEFMADNSPESIEKSFFGLNLEDVNFAFGLNFMGTLMPTMIFAKDMIEKKSGVILNISSMAAQRPLTKVMAYSAAKAAVDNFTSWLAVHFAKVGIRVNAIAPGFLLTDQNRFLLLDKETHQPTERGLKILANTPMGRYGETEELTGATAFLLSDLSRFITGVVLPIDGGFSTFSGV